MKKTYLVLLFILLGGALRFHNLGTFSFWIDELYHVSSAESYLRDGSLHVPFKGEYTRSKPTTWITIASFYLFGQSEATARAPFVLINLLFILLAYFVIRNLFGDPIALIFSFVMCFAPFSILISRECRMYSLTQLLYFWTSASFIFGFENLSQFGRGLWSKVENIFNINIFWLLVSIVSLLMAVKVHTLSFNFALVIGCYAFIMMIYLGVTESWKNALASKYSLLILMELAGLVSIAVAQPEFINSMIFQIRDIPPNFEFINPKGDYHFYRYYFTDFYPSLFLISPFGMFLLVKQFGKKGLFFAVSFVFMFLLHSIVYERKADRYIFYIFPFMILGGVTSIVFIAQSIMAGLRTLVGNDKKWIRVSSVFFAITLVYIVLNPWFLDGLRCVRVMKFPDWKTLSQDRLKAIRETPNIISGNPNELLYYTGVNSNYYFMLDINPKHEYEPGMIYGYDEFVKALSSNPDSMVVTTRFTFQNNANFTEPMRAYVLAHMDPIGNDSNSEILIFRTRNSS